MVLVELLNLTCDLELDVRRVSHVKFAPLDGRRPRHFASWALQFGRKKRISSRL
ncbi:hypothetical protein CHELA40_12309 [Chelatococcus asaccharovorans]|nr:hypothetical protein CHELA40_12309 [Chelatococcus asaccharovorans]